MADLPSGERAGLERLGVEPVPRELQTVRWRNLAVMTFSYTLSPVFFVLGALAVTVGGLPLWWAAGAGAAGQAAAWLCLAVAARAGVAYGLSGQVAMRATFGEWGARGLTSPYRAVAASYWFAVQALAGALGVQALVQALSGRELGLVPISVILASVGAVLAVVGFGAMRNFPLLVLPLMIVFTAVIVGLYVTADDPRFGVSQVFDAPSLSFTWLGFATFMTVMWGGALTAVTNVADFCRYTPTRRGMEIGLFVGGVLGTFIATWVGAYGAIASGSMNPFAAATQLTGNPAILVVLLLALAAQTTSVNIMNLYTAGLSLVNTAPRLGRVGATAALAIVAVALSASPEIVNQAQRWLTHLGNVGAPLAGVIVADYLVVKRQQLDLSALFDRTGRYRYLRGLNPASLVAVAIGVAVFYVVPDAWLKPAWGVLVAASAYLALVLLQEELLPATRAARGPTDRERRGESGRRLPLPEG